MPRIVHHVAPLAVTPSDVLLVTRHGDPNLFTCRTGMEGHGDGVRFRSAAHGIDVIQSPAGRGVVTWEGLAMFLRLGIEDDTREVVTAAMAEHYDAWAARQRAERDGAPYEVLCEANERVGAALRALRRAVDDVVYRAIENDEALTDELERALHAETAP